MENSITLHHFTTHSARETLAFAQGLAQKQASPALILLKGDLGLGKTTFVQGFIKGLQGAKEVRVKSPTYTLVRTYDTTPRVHHIDLYRLSDETMAFDLGIEEIIHDNEGAIILIEWPEKFSLLETLPHVEICFKQGAKVSERIISIKQH